MKKALLLFFVIVISNLAVYSQEPVPVKKSETIRMINGIEYYIHTIEKGQTLYSISKEYSISQDELLVLNPQLKEGPQPGQELRIPIVKAVPGQVTNTEISFIYHIVKKSETLASIARMYGVGESEILSVNGLKNSELHPDAVLKIPMDYSSMMSNAKQSGKETEVKNEFTDYQIAGKETLYSISRKFNVAIADLLEWNPELQNGPKIGQIIKIGKPTPKSKSGENSLYIEHKVNRKESLYGIARHYSMSIDSIKLFNPGLTEALNEGQIILIPKDRKLSAYITHTSVANEKTSEIAENYAVTEEKLKEANPGLGEKVKKTESIKIPVESQPETVNPAETISKSSETEDAVCPADYKHRDDEFRVALMLPFSLDDYDTLAFIKNRGKKVKDYPFFKYIQFYEGALMALDTLEKQGLKAKVYVYDVSKDVENTKRLLQKPELKGMNMIICLAFTKNFEAVADFAKHNSIPVVNAISKRDEIIKDNNMVFKAMPSEEYLADNIVNFLKQKHVKQNVLIMRANKYQGTALCNSLNAKIKSLFKENQSGSRVVYLNDSLVHLNKNLKPGYENIVISVAENQAYIMDLLRVLSSRRDTLRFSVIGLPSWDELSNLETNRLSELNVHMVTPLIVDYSDTQTNEFVMKFREKYLIEPDELAFKGYDLTLYFMNALMRFGTNFQSCIQNLKVNTLQSKYAFVRQGNHGYVNSIWNIYYIQGFKPIILR